MLPSNNTALHFATSMFRTQRDTRDRRPSAHVRRRPAPFLLNCELQQPESGHLRRILKAGSKGKGGGGFVAPRLEDNSAKVLGVRIGKCENGCDGEEPGLSKNTLSASVATATGSDLGGSENVPQSAKSAGFCGHPQKPQPCSLPKPETTQPP